MLRFGSLRRATSGLALFLCAVLPPLCLPGATPTPVPLSISKSASPSSGLLVGDTVNVCIEVSTPKPMADIVWVFDISTSMELGLTTTVANILSFTAQLATQGIDYRQALVTFTGGFNAFGNMIWVYNYGQPGPPYVYGWAPDDATFSAWLTGTSTVGGIEADLEIMDYIRTHMYDTIGSDWRPGASRHFILVTDEAIPCSETGYIYPDGITPAGYSFASFAALMAADKITVHSISRAWPGNSDPEGRCDPQPLPAMTGGLWLDYDQPASAWGGMLAQIAAAIAGNSNVLVSDPVPPELAPIPDRLNGGTLSGNTVSWSVSSTVQGQVLQFCFDARVNAPWDGFITNTAHVEADNVPDTPSNPVPLLFATRTPTPSFTNSPTPSATPTHTLTATPSPTWTPTRTPTPTHTPTATPSATPTLSWTSSPTPTRTATSSSTRTQTWTFTDTPTSTATPTATPSVTATASFTDTPTSTPSASLTQTFTATPSFSPSPSVTPTFVPAPYHVILAVYNSAGERVRILYDGLLSGPPGGATTQPGLLAEWNSTVDLLLPPGVTTPYGQDRFRWDGTNSAGQAVANGTYLFKADVDTSTGSVVSYTWGVQVVLPERSLGIGIFNSAGELVARLPVPPGADASNFNVLSPSGETLTLVLPQAGGSRSLFWDGLNRQGRPASPGLYWVRSLDSSSGRSQPFTLLKAAPGLGRLSAGPNPLSAGAAAFHLLFEARPGAQAWATLYNLAGEAVAEVRGDAGTGRLSLPAGHLADGIYLLILDVNGVQAYRRSLKLAVAR